LTVDEDEFTDPIDAWPEVPEPFRPKRLPHSGAFQSEHCKVLEERGYEPVDVRFLEGQEKVKALLEASLLGTAKLSKDQQSALRLAAEVYGLKGIGRGRQTDDTKKRIAGDDVDSILAAFNRRDVAGFSPRKKASASPTEKAAQDRKSKVASLTSIRDRTKKKVRAK
jgi:hypothetical protein